MDRENFMAQLRRLSDVYGERSYPKERMTILWRAVQAHPEDEFLETVDRCIATERSAPMVDRILEVLEEVRSNRRRSRDSGSQVGILDVVKEIAATAENKALAQKCVQVITEKIEGRLNAEQFEQACQLIEAVGDALNPGCKWCDGSGLIFRPNKDGYNLLFRCECRVGRQHANPMFAPSDKASTEPIHLQPFRQEL